MNQTQENSPMDWKSKYVLLHKEVSQLREELRFATVLIALLLILGLWGFWQRSGPPSETAPRMPSRRLSPVSPMGTQATSPAHPNQGTLAPITRRPSLSSEPRPEPLRPLVPFPVSPEKSNRRFSQPRRPIDSSQTRRSLRTQPLSPMSSQKRRHAASRRATSSKFPRFGEPVPSHLVPSHWCPAGFVYGSYRPCLKYNAQRRCIQRSEQLRYSCIPQSWKKRIIRPQKER